MALADSSNAIGAVTKLLVQKLSIAPIPDARAGRPDKIGDAFSGVNIFLYDVERDAAMANVSLQEGEAPPLWFVLKYLLTAAKAGETDSADSHIVLGQALAALQNLNFLTPSPGTPEAKALAPSGESLKITFEPGSADVVSKVMHGATDERFRLSIAFQVRPIAIVPAAPEKFNLLVGIDYTQSPQKVIGLDGVQVDVLASLGPKPQTIEPLQIAPGESFTIQGVDLHLSGLECLLNGVPLPVTAQRPDRLTVLAAVAGTGLSAGELPLTVRQPLKGGRWRNGPLLTARLLPLITSASATLVALKQTITLQGELLGGDTDDIWIALLRDGAVLAVFEGATTQPDQKQLVLTISPSLLAGPALVILRVNGQQAHSSPSILLT